jgi:hypothetical protein
MADEPSMNDMRDMLGGDELASVNLFEMAELGGLEPATSGSTNLAKGPPTTALPLFHRFPADFALANPLFHPA